MRKGRKKKINKEVKEDAVIEERKKERVEQSGSTTVEAESVPT